MILDTTSKLTSALAEFTYAAAAFTGRQAVNIFLRGDLAAPIRQTAAFLTTAADVLAGAGCGCGEQAGIAPGDAPAGSGWGPVPSGD
jgi:hypothetical protein